MKNIISPMETSIEAVATMDKMIEAMPDKIKDEKKIGFMISAQFANALKDYVEWTGNFMKPTLVKGDEFYWKGYLCKVI